MPADTLTASEKFEAEAKRWEETRRLRAFSGEQYAFLRLQCWLLSDGAKADGVSKTLKRYYSALKARLRRKYGRDWLDSYLSIRDNCRCGESFRMENLSVCTNCYVSLGYCHRSSGGTAPNGNPLCPSCKVGEIVG
jgi:hypothetical protein